MDYCEKALYDFVQPLNVFQENDQVQIHFLPIPLVCRILHILKSHDNSSRRFHIIVTQHSGNMEYKGSEYVFEAPMNAQIQNIKLIRKALGNVH